MRRIVLKLVFCITVVLCLTASVYAASGVSIEIGPPKTAKPGDLITHVFTIKNTGTNADQYNLKITLPAGWVALPIPSQVSLTVGETSQVFLTVIVPGKATAGSYNVVLRATSTTNPSIWAEAEGVIKLVPAAALELEAFQISRAPPGAEAKYVFRIRNTGNVVDTYRVDTRSDKDWTLRISQGEVQVLPGDREEFIVTVRVPRTVAPGTRYYLWVEATSQADSTVTETLQLTTSVAPPPPDEVRVELYPELPLVIRFQITEAGDPTLGLSLAGNLPGIGKLKATRSLGLLGVTNQSAGFYTSELGVDWGSVSVSGAFAELSGEGLRFLWDGTGIGGTELLLTDVGKGFAGSWEWETGTLRLVSVSMETPTPYGVNEIQFAGRLSEAFSLAAILASANTQSGPSSAFQVKPSIRNDLMSGYLEFGKVSPGFPEKPESTTFSWGLSFGGTETPLSGSFSNSQTTTLTDPGPPQVFITTQSLQATGSFSPNRGTSLALSVNLEGKESDDTPKTTQGGSSNLSLTFTSLINEMNWSLVTSFKQAWDSVAGTDFSTIGVGLSAGVHVGQTDLSGMVQVEEIRDLITDTTSETTSSFSLSCAFPQLFLTPTIKLAVSTGDASLSTELSWVDVTGWELAASLSMPLIAGGGFSSTLEFTFPIVIPFFGPTYGIIRGQVFIDENKNGILDPGEKGVPGLLLSANGQEAITGSSGQFVFWPLVPARYHVEINKVPSGLSPLCRLPIDVRLAVGQQVELSIPMETRSQIDGVVFHDRNRNGTRGGGEPGVAEVQISITNELFVKSLRTDALGRFSLDVPPGIYQVELLIPSLPRRFEMTTPSTVQVVVGEGMRKEVSFGAYQRPREIIITFMPPVARFTIQPPKPKANERVVLDAGDSYAPNGTIAKYEWDLEINGEHIKREGQVIQHVFPEGTHRITLTVTDNDGLTDTTTKHIAVTR